MSEPFGDFKKVAGLRLFACDGHAGESLERAANALEILAVRSPETLEILRRHIRYICTVDEGRWSHQVIDGMRLLRWDVSSLRDTSRDQQQALLRQIAMELHQAEGAA